MTISDIAANPLIASTTATLANGLELAVRPLLKSDKVRFGEFLSSLSPATNLLYQPHPLNIQAAHTICENLDYTAQLPFIAVTRAGYIVSYFLFDFTYSQHESVRYQTYGITLDPSLDCRFAPVVADKYQGQGVGKTVFKGLLPILKKLPLRSLILSGGTQEGNRQAINFYEKIGFRLMGEFDENNMRNYDMRLTLQ